jgi:hypothetical protein
MAEYKEYNIKSEHFKLFEDFIIGRNGEAYAEVDFRSGYIPEMKAMFTLEQVNQANLPLDGCAYGKPSVHSNILSSILADLAGMYVYSIKLSNIINFFSFLLFVYC